MYLSANMQHLILLLIIARSKWFWNVLPAKGQVCGTFIKHVDSGLLSAFTCNRRCLFSLLSASTVLPFIPHSLSVCLSQASNGNDPWSAWNADPSGGSNNNWASNPEGTQTGRIAADPWGTASQGHPQAYQGPGNKKITKKMFYQQLHM